MRYNLYLNRSDEEFFEFIKMCFGQFEDKFKYKPLEIILPNENAQDLTKPNKTVYATINGVPVSFKKYCMPKHLMLKLAT